MPIRAHAAGGRVSPHLGPRPPAWPHDKAGMCRSWRRDGGPHGGGIAVTLLRSAPRPAYRMYSEEEFLAAEDWPVETESEFALVGQASPRRRESKRWGALAALAALPCVIAAVVGVVALNATRTKPRSSRRVAARGGSPPEPLPIGRASGGLAHPFTNPPGGYLGWLDVSPGTSSALSIGCRSQHIHIAPRRQRLPRQRLPRQPP